MRGAKWNVLVVVAHPDDETLGCGGTLAWLGSFGARVTVVAVGTGVGARIHGDPVVLKSDSVEVTTRRSEMAKAARLLGVEQADFPDDPPPDNVFDMWPVLRLVRGIETLLQRIGPATVYTHHPGDLNIDHQTVARAVLTAIRPSPDQSVRRCLAFEVPGSTDWYPLASPFVPNSFSELTEDCLEQKLAALACYESEARAAPHPRSPESVRALARWRGSQCGHVYAEAFEVLREVW